LGVKLLLNHHLDYLPDKLINDSLPGLRDTEMISDGLLSQLLDQDGNDAIEDGRGLEKFLNILLVLEGLPGDLFFDIV
jgi:hypothetical protein